MGHDLHPDPDLGQARRLRRSRAWGSVIEEMVPGQADSRRPRAGWSAHLVQATGDFLRRCGRRHRAHPRGRGHTHAAERLGHPHLRGPRRGRACRCLGRCVDPPGAVRSAAPVAHRRHRPPRGSRALGPTMAPVQLSRATQLPSRSQGRLWRAWRHHRPGARPAPATRGRGHGRATPAARARRRASLEPTPAI